MDTIGVTATSKRFGSTLHFSKWVVVYNFSKQALEKDGKYVNLMKTLIPKMYFFSCLSETTGVYNSKEGGYRI